MCTEILSHIEQQRQFLLRTRALFPYVNDDLVGADQFQTAPLYQSYGHNIHFVLPEPLTLDTINSIRSVGHWINQNYVIRLSAYLEYHGIIPKEGQGKINQDLSGWNEVDILRRLRNKFAHSSGRYNSEDSNSRTLFLRVVEHFSLQEDENTATEYPIPIDSVLLPLTEGCRQYVLEHSNQGGV